MMAVAKLQNKTDGDEHISDYVNSPELNRRFAIDLCFLAGFRCLREC